MPTDMPTDQTAQVPESATSPADQTSGAPALLQLAAMDADDLAVLSAHLQDMRIAVGDFAYLPAERRFALVGKRFDWVKAAAGGCERCATGLHFDRVQGVARSGFAQGDADRQLNLLSIEFQEVEETKGTEDARGIAASGGADGASPGGAVTLTFSGGAALRLTVECLEAQMRDLGERWPCDRTPLHP